MHREYKGRPLSKKRDFFFREIFMHLSCIIGNNRKWRAKEHRIMQKQSHSKGLSNILLIGMWRRNIKYEAFCRKSCYRNKMQVCYYCILQNCRKFLYFLGMWTFCQCTMLNGTVKMRIRSRIICFVFI